MDGTLAVIFLLTSLGDMTLNECPTGCLAAREAENRFAFQLSDVQFQDDSISEEIYVTYDSAMRYGPFQPTVGISGTVDGDLWIGGGVKWTSQNLSPGPLFFETSLMPGLYAQGDGPDLGGNLQFRSAVGVGYTFANGATLTVLYDHRSNADTQNLNPGLETLGLRYAIALD